MEIPALILRPDILGTAASDVEDEAVESCAGQHFQVRDLSIRFGGIIALDNVTFDVNPGTICGLIGPNGAGKTTLFNCISRFYQPSKGSITFKGQDLLELPRHAIAPLGVARTFQNLALFRTMTVFDNVMVGAHPAAKSSYLANAFRLPSVDREEGALRQRARRILEFLTLEKYADRYVSDLPFGIQKRVEFGRALASEPSLVLLDEPATGLNHEELGDLGRLISDVRSKLGITVLLVEHHMSLVMSISDKVVALDFGRKVADGTPSEVQRNPDVIRAYLGGGTT